MAKRDIQKPDKQSNRSSVPVGGGRHWVTPFAALVGVIGAFMVLRSILMDGGRVARINELAGAGWGQLATAIVNRQVAALAHGGLLMLLAGAGVWWLARSARRSNKLLTTVAAGLVIVAAVDSYLLARRYITTGSLAALRENPVIQLLKNDGESRVALVSQESFYNYWLTYVFPYHGIRSVNITQMPRMPEDYQAFLGQVGRNMTRFWELSAVEFILGPAPLWNQIQADPEMRGRFALAMSYDVAESKPGVFTVYPAPPDRPGQHVVLRVVSPSPRFVLMTGWETVPDTTALERLADPGFRPFQRLLVAEEYAASLPALDGSGITGHHELLEYRSGYMKLKLQTETPALLRIAEKHDPDWRATLNGVETPVVRVDYLFQGVYIPAGSHELVLKFSPPHRTIWLQILSIVICLGAMAVLTVRWLRARKPAASPTAA